MNFFTVGFLLALMPLDLGWGVGYIIKAAGALFLFGGIAELMPFEKSIVKHRPLAAMLLLAGAASAGAVFGLSKLGHNTAYNIAGLLSGVVTTAIAVLFFRKFFALLKERPDLAANEAELRRLSARFDRMLFVTVLVLAADALNRFTGGTVVADAAGIVMVVTKLTFYCFLISCGLSLNKIRQSFNKAHSA